MIWSMEQKRQIAGIAKHCLKTNDINHYARHPWIVRNGDLTGALIATNGIELACLLNWMPTITQYDGDLSISLKGELMQVTQGKQPDVTGIIDASKVKAYARMGNLDSLDIAALESWNDERDHGAQHYRITKHGLSVVIRAAFLHRLMWLKVRAKMGGHWKLHIQQDSLVVQYSRDGIDPAGIFAAMEADSTSLRGRCIPTYNL